MVPVLNFVVLLSHHLESEQDCEQVNYSEHKVHNNNELVKTHLVSVGGNQKIRKKTRHVMRPRRQFPFCEKLIIRHLRMGACKNKKFEGFQLPKSLNKRK